MAEIIQLKFKFKQSRKRKVVMARKKNETDRVIRIDNNTVIIVKPKDMHLSDIEIRQRHIRNKNISATNSIYNINPQANIINKPKV